MNSCKEWASQPVPALHLSRETIRLFEPLNPGQSQICVLSASISQHIDAPLEVIDHSSTLALAQVNPHNATRNLHHSQANNHQSL